jgi:opacity protein-like surface antigen
MKKMTTALVAAVALASSAYASTGFYIGANVGAANTNVKYDWKVDGKVLGGGSTSLTTAAARTQNTRIDAGKFGMIFGAFAGYGMAFGNGAYAGAELVGGVDSSKVTPLDDSNSGVAVSLGKAQVKRKSFYGIAPRIGYMISPSTLAYLRLGLEGGKWEAQYAPNEAAVDANAGSATVADVAEAKRIRKVSKNRINFVPGIGFETAVNKNMFVRAEYAYLFGPKMNIDYDTSKLGNTAQFNGDLAKHSFKISQHSFKLGLGYKF